MKLGVVADDFTGASDIALMLRSGGMSVSQFVGTPKGDVTGIDAGVVSLKSRTCPVDEAISLSLEAARWLVGQGAEQVIFKVCSTFDSTAEGNIGQVAEVLAEELGETSVLVCPAFPENGRSVYQGNLFVGDKLLNQSGMENHPLTPMTNSDVREMLADQTGWPVAHVPFKTVDAGADEINSAIPEAKSMVVVDAIRDADLVTIGQAAKGRKFLVGGSGIAMGLPANFGISGATQSWAGRSGKAVILSGSCSIATRGQVEKYAALHDVATKELTAAAMIGGEFDVDGMVNWALAQSNAPLIYSSADPSVVKAAQKLFGQQQSASAFESFFAEFANKFVSAGGQRIVVAGGETSGAVVEGMSVSKMNIGPEIAPGVPCLDVEEKQVAIALKSGNFGQPDFFERALDILATADE